MIYIKTYNKERAKPLKWTYYLTCIAILGLDIEHCEAWVMHGWCMDNAFILRCRSMDNAWVMPSSFGAEAWEVHGECMDQAWRMHEKSIACACNP